MQMQNNNLTNEILRGALNHRAARPRTNSKIQNLKSKIFLLLFLSYALCEVMGLIVKALPL